MLSDRIRPLPRRLHLHPGRMVALSPIQNRSWNTDQQELDPMAIELTREELFKQVWELPPACGRRRGFHGRPSCG